MQRPIVLGMPAELCFVCWLVAMPVTAQQDAPSPVAAAESEEAQPEAEPRDEEDDLGWANSTELSLVATYGNSDTETLGLRNHLRYRWSNARYSLRADGLRTRNADQKFVQVLPFPGDPATVDLSEFIVLVEPRKELDAEKYLIENIYDQRVSDRLIWNIGFTWDRNNDANIRNRYVAFGGLGHIWWSRSDLHFETSYGLSYTDRNEVNPDPEKDAEFPGLRLAWRFSKGWGQVTTFGNEWTSNVNLSDTGDWNFDTTSWLSVAINRHLALKVSLQWLHNSRPALQEIEILAVLPEGVRVDFGDVDVRKERLDTILTTSIVVDF